MTRAPAKSNASAAARLSLLRIRLFQQGRGIGIVGFEPLAGEGDPLAAACPMPAIAGQVDLEAFQNAALLGFGLLLKGRFCLVFVEVPVRVRFFEFLIGRPVLLRFFAPGRYRNNCGGGGRVCFSNRLLGFNSLGVI